MAEYSIQTQSLNFRYSKHKKILDDISLNIPKGSIYGFLGPNGAGKTTVFNMLTKFLIPTRGQALSQQVPNEKMPVRAN